MASCGSDPSFDVAKEAGEEPEKYPLATTEELVMEKAELLWKRWLRTVVEGHLADCQNAMSAGGAPRAASGFTKHALELLGIADPGEQYFLNLSKGGNNGGASGDVKAILASQGQMMQTMMSVVLAMASGQKLDPEMLKTAMEPAKSPETLMSGVATGKITKPLSEPTYGQKFEEKTRRRKNAQRQRPPRFRNP